MEESSCSQFMVSKKESKLKRNGEKDEVERQGRWSSEQNIKYLVFLSYNQSKFECKKKRMFRLYKPLSKFIQTRNSEQCRSHHRKLLQRFKTPRNIILNLEQHFSKDQIQQLKEKTLQKLKELHIPQKKIRNNEKSEFSSRGIEQKNHNQYQNSARLFDKIQERQLWISNEKIITNQTTEYSTNLSSTGEIALMHYQALNWISQMSLSNYNYFYNPNYLCYFNSSLLSQKTHNSY